jgi:hypothetical protein
MTPFKKDLLGMSLEMWYADQNNVALTDGVDYGLFELTSPGVYTGHSFCISRGKDAREFYRNAIDYLFRNYDCKAIRGLTPCSNKAACWMARQGGFTSYGIIDTDIGPHEVFILTKKEYNNE